MSANGDVRHFLVACGPSRGGSTVKAFDKDYDFALGAYEQVER
jgi:hypothetical protein